MIVRRSGENFIIDSEQAKRLFTKNDLASLSLEVSHNCCSNEVDIKDLEFEFPEANCVYELDYCTHNANNVICVKPDGTDVCTDVYYTKVRRLYLSVNGQDVAAVKGEYDITNPTDVAKLKEAIDQYFIDEGYKNIISTVEVTTANQGADYCIKIRIEGLPNGVIPESIVIGNDSPCFALPLFECVLEGRGDCVELEAKISLDKNNKNVYPTYYRIYNIIIDDNGTEQEVVLNATFNYYVPNPTSVDFTGLNSYLKSQLALAGYDIDFNLSIDQSHNLVIKASNWSHEPKYISLIYPILESFGVDNFSCSAYEEPLPVCEWKTEIIRDMSGSDISTLSTLFVYDDSYIAPISIINNAYDLSIASQRLEFINEANQWFIDNNYSQATIDVVATDATYTIYGYNMPDNITPYSVVLADTNSDIFEFLFYCGNIDNLPEGFEYDPNSLEYRPDYIIVKPPYFGYSNLKDGIYSFKLTIKDKSNVEYVENYCYFIDDEVKCNIIKALVKKPESNLHHYYESILHVSDCNDCDCGKACELYKYLLINLNEILNGKQQMCRCYNC